MTATQDTPNPEELSAMRVALVGVGLIGGSLGLALRRHVGCHVVGWDSADALALALERDAISQGAASLGAAVSEADVVVLCTPLGTSLTLLEQMASHLKAGALVTDVGSVKRPIVDHAQAVLPENVTFIGGHPMTGSEKKGVAHADALLFENAVYVLCPENQGSGAFRVLSALVTATGARVLVMGAEAHDAAAARVSHIPQLLAVGLVNLISGDEDSARLAAGGFRDMTRIASSSFDMWRDILVANQGPVLDELGALAADLQRLRNRIAASDMEGVAEGFRTAAGTRASIPEGTKGFLNPLTDVFVYTPDEPKALLRITQSLSEAGLDIKDIELLKIREGTGGTFRLGFDGERTADNAVQALEHSGFHAYRL